MTELLSTLILSSLSSLSPLSLHIKLNNSGWLGESPLGLEQIGCDEIKNVRNYRGHKAGPGNARKAIIYRGVAWP